MPHQFTNTSLALFGTKDISLLYLDPYNNSFGEKNWLVISSVICFTICCIFSICLMIGIVVFGSFSQNAGNRSFLDRVRIKCKRKIPSTSHHNLLFSTNLNHEHFLAFKKWV